MKTANAVREQRVRFSHRVLWEPDANLVWASLSHHGVRQTPDSQHITAVEAGLRAELC